MAIKSTPTVYVISGPNGAGKTTFATRFLPDFADCHEFVNADLIAAGLSPFTPETQVIRASRLLLSRVRDLAEKRLDFGFETTLSGRTYLKILSKMKSDGYKIRGFFLWLPTVEIAVERVAERVRQGGHDISKPVIHRRFHLGKRNLSRLYGELWDSLLFFDASELPPRMIAEKSGKILKIIDQPTYDKMMLQMGGR